MARETEEISSHLLRVDHAGEHGAIHIYRVQIALAQLLCPELVLQLVHMLDHERGHREVFRQLLQERGSSPCRCGPAWALGGAGLGLITGLFGKSGILLCTAAVESAVDRHLSHQIAWLDERDAGAAAAIRAIRLEELEHLDFAESGPAGGLFLRHFVRPWIEGLTDLLIWVGTRGASSRLAYC